MTLAHRAKIEATPNFLRNLADAREFLIGQDVVSAPARFSKLQDSLREMVELIVWEPGIGKPARFLLGRTAQARLRAARVQGLAEQSGLPQIREFLVEHYIVLYAHSEADIVLLAIKHERQLLYKT